MIKSNYITFLLLFAVAVLATPTMANEPLDPNLPICGGDVSDADWRTGQNSFYAEIGQQGFESVASSRGMDAWPDYNHKSVRSLLGIGEVASPPPGSVLVLGAGFGRDLKFLCEHTNIPRLEIVEVGAAQQKELSKLASMIDGDLIMNRRRAGKPNQTVTLHDLNIADEVPVSGIQVAFWTYAGILELSSNEKKKAIRNVARSMLEGGVLVVDFYLGQGPPDSQTTTDGVLRVKNPSGEQSLRLHPINHLTREVNEAKLKEYLFDNGFFEFWKEEIYTTEGPRGKSKRKLLFLTRTSKSPAKK